MAQIFIYPLVNHGISQVVFSIWGMTLALLLTMKFAGPVSANPHIFEKLDDANDEWNRADVVAKETWRPFWQTSRCPQFWGGKPWLSRFVHRASFLIRFQRPRPFASAQEDHSRAKYFGDAPGCSGHTALTFRICDRFRISFSAIR